MLAVRSSQTGTVARWQIMTASSEQQDDEEEEIREHLQDVDDGCGCAEIWEHMSEERDDV